MVSVICSISMFANICMHVLLCDKIKFYYVMNPFRCSRACPYIETHLYNIHQITLESQANVLLRLLACNAHACVCVRMCVCDTRIFITFSNID